MAKKKDKNEEKEGQKPSVHEELEGFSVEINEFGEITSSFEIDKLNEFLNRKVEDKKLKGGGEEEE